jgi:Fe-S cluster biosynthesis and repair protein YggX
MNVTCARCHQDKPGLENPPYPGDLGEEIVARVCSDCWNEWQQAEVMVINEFRLNFMDPRANEILVQHLREFLVLDQPAATGE